jgi:hypothetical protein
MVELFLSKGAELKFYWLKQKGKFRSCCSDFGRLIDSFDGDNLRRLEALFMITYKMPNIDLVTWETD